MSVQEKLKGQTNKTKKRVKRKKGRATHAKRGNWENFEEKKRVFFLFSFILHKCGKKRVTQEKRERKCANPGAAHVTAT